MIASSMICIGTDCPSDTSGHASGWDVAIVVLIVVALLGWAVIRRWRPIRRKDEDDD